MLKNVCDEFVLCKINKKNNNSLINNIFGPIGRDIQLDDVADHLYI